MIRTKPSKLPQQVTKSMFKNKKTLSIKQTKHQPTIRPSNQPHEIHSSPAPAAAAARDALELLLPLRELQAQVSPRLGASVELVSWVWFQQNTWHVAPCFKLHWIIIIINYPILFVKTWEYNMYNKNKSTRPLLIWLQSKRAVFLPTSICWSSSACARATSPVGRKAFWWGPACERRCFGLMCPAELLLDLLFSGVVFGWFYNAL